MVEGGAAGGIPGPPLGAKEDIIGGSDTPLTKGPMGETVFPASRGLGSVSK